MLVRRGICRRRSSTHACLPTCCSRAVACCDEVQISHGVVIYAWVMVPSEFAA